MSITSYSKHQKSRLKRYVATLEDGTRIQADTEKEMNSLIKKHKTGESIGDKDGNESKLFDSKTGKPIE